MAGKVYGYARISRPSQSLDRQLSNIKSAYPRVTKIYPEAFTGRTMSRPEWNKLMKVIGSGDTIVFDSVSRMSRDAEEGMAIYERLYDMGVELVFLKEPNVNTSVYRAALQNRIDADLKADNAAVSRFLTDLQESLNRLIRDLAKEQIRIAFNQSEKEVSDLRQRTREGIQQARLKKDGKNHEPGRKKNAVIITKKQKEAFEKIQKHAKEFGGSLSDQEVITLCGCSRNSYYKYKRLIREERLNEQGIIKGQLEMHV